MDVNKKIERYLKKPRALILDKRLTSSEQDFLCLIAQLIKHGDCHASNQYLANYFGVGRPRAVKVIGRLTTKGFISCRHTYKGKIIVKRTINIIDPKTIKTLLRGRVERDLTDRVDSTPPDRVHPTQVDRVERGQGGRVERGRVTLETTHKRTTTCNDDDVDCPDDIKKRFSGKAPLREFVDLCGGEKRMREIFTEVDKKKGIGSPTGLAVTMARGKWQPTPDGPVEMCSVCGKPKHKGNNGGNLCLTCYGAYTQKKQGRQAYGIKEYVKEVKCG